MDIPSRDYLIPIVATIFVMIWIVALIFIGQI
jgi:hypothetical protein